ncbi:alpha/beta hydrolase protein, partial [Haematococcus lacustris]
MGVVDALALCWALARVVSLSQAAVALTLCRWLLGLERVGSLLELGRRCVTAGAAACFRHTWLPEKRRAFQLLAMSEQWLARRDRGVVLEELGTQGAVQGLWPCWAGGAMVAGASGMYARSFTRLVQQLQALGVSARLLSVEYPLAPEQPHPAALQATLAAWRHLLQCSQQGQGKAYYAI